MGFFKALFIGVHASNAATRALFLPLCYVLLSSPFLLILSRYYRVNTKLSAVLGERSLAEHALAVFVCAMALLLPTRMVSGRSRGGGPEGRVRSVQLLPYWVPGVRHWGDLVFRGDAWLEGVRYVCGGGEVVRACLD